MNEEPGLNRRRFMAAVSGGGLTLTGGLIAWRLWQPQLAARIRRVRLEKRLLHVLRERLVGSPGAERFGPMYLKLRPQDSSQRALLAPILESVITTDHEALSRSDEALAALVRNLIQQDFDAGRTVSLDGWRLSETEGRICALVTL